MSVRVRNAALAGEFVSLELLLEQYNISPDDDFKSYIDSQGQLHVKSARQKRTITNVYRWLEAWGVYENLLIRHYGLAMYSNMSLYRARIVGLTQKYRWSHVMLYDIRHRRKLSTYRSFDFSIVDQELYLSVFDSQSVRSGSRCNKCLAFDHSTGECPFKARDVVGIPDKKKALKNDICEKFQENKCRFGSKCYRKHVCSACGSSEPKITCKCKENRTDFMVKEMLTHMY